MKIIAGIDIGNSTTEVAIACQNNGELQFLSNDIVKTTGIKGTAENIQGIKRALLLALGKTSYELHNVDVICINEAIPVIGELAMATLTETIITESAMIGHNPSTPGGLGLGSGKTVRLTDLLACQPAETVIPIVPKEVSFDQVARIINEAIKNKIDVQGAIVKNDDGVLIAKRIEKVIPVVDEIDRIEEVPVGLPAVVEVAEAGRTITELCNPYGIATLFGLNSIQTRKIAPIAISLIGNKSAVVIQTPKGGIKERKIPVGKLFISGQKSTHEVDLVSGAKKIMSTVEKVGPLEDAYGESGTSVGGMLAKIKKTLGDINGQPLKSIKIRDLFAVDTIVPQKVKGGIAGEYSRNQAVGLAAMVWTDKSMMQDLVSKLKAESEIPVNIGGTEVRMALLGALTTPGVEKPLVILDMGAGSIDAASFDSKGNVKFVHLAGAGDMLTMLIDSELDFKDLSLSEMIKIFPAAKVESLFHIKLEDGSLKFFKNPLNANLLGRVVIIKENQEMTPLPKNISLEKLISIRKDMKKKVFINNVVRALKRITPNRNLRLIHEIVLLGGSALDFEIPGIISEFLLRNYGVITGRGNIRGKLGPRNAVATGLILSFCQKGGEI